MRTALTVLFAVALSGCKSSSAPLSVGALAKEYQQSISAARLKYDGKEITVRGRAIAAASTPVAGADQGSVLLQDESGRLACWFSSEQVERFSQVRSGQELTITGVFSGEAGVELKFCRLVQLE
jgi:hypothetical protein